MRQVDLVVMSGWGGGSEVEQLVDGARRAIAIDLIDKALSIDVFARIIVSTNDDVLADLVRGLGVIIEKDPPDVAFHFGLRLQQVIAKYSIEAMLYFGAGCAPLLSDQVLAELANKIGKADRLFVANNFYSVDFCAFTPATVLLSLEAPVYDNGIGWLLSQEGGLPAEELPRTTATVFDVDTPTDVLLLARHPAVPPHTRDYLDSLSLDTSRVDRVGSAFVDPAAEVLISGRVGSRVMAFLEQQSASRTRVFSEERGMRADGRLDRGQVRSLLGMHIEAVGLEQFFQQVVPELGQAAVIDDRVIWAHHRVWPLARDRFCSDLFWLECITEPYVHRFTKAALACPVPLVLGGHSVVSGGLHVLVEGAWTNSGIDIDRPVKTS
jgi:hypothetical protein